MFQVILTEAAQLDVVRLAKSEPSSIKKLNRLMEELREHPTTGTGHPEQLKKLDGITWSRRISKKHRLVYKIIDDRVLVNVVSAYGHYGNK